MTTLTSLRAHPRLQDLQAEAQAFCLEPARQPAANAMILRLIGAKAVGFACRPRGASFGDWPFRSEQWRGFGGHRYRYHYRMPTHGRDRYPDPAAGAMAFEANQVPPAPFIAG